MDVRTLTIGLIAASLAIGCAGKKAAQEAEDELSFGGPTFSRDEDGNVVRKFDIDGDDKTDVTKVFAEYPDPDDPSITRQRLIRKEVDVNSDGNVNMRRLYNEEGELMQEEADTNLDGKMDVIRHIDGGQVVQKDVLDSASGVVVASRYYYEGNLQRVEKDTNQDDKVDYWEFYEQGVLDRIGRDLNGDGRADTWQRR
jgi:hypothetical protein